MKPRNSRPEIEIKLRVADISALRLALKQLRAREVCPRTHESNTIYDDANRSLAARGELVRIRIERPASTSGSRPQTGAGNSVITYKGPAQSSRRAIAAPGKKPRYKIKQEVEIVLGNHGREAINMHRIFRALGLRPVFQYEKYRTTYALPGVSDLKVELDETPVGLYLELEGSEPAIDHAAKLLGYAIRDYITQTYGALYLTACRRSGLKPGNMLFKSSKIMR